MGSKKKNNKVAIPSDDDINKLRLLNQTKTTAEHLDRRSEKDSFDALVRAELTIEDYLYVHGSAISSDPQRKEELRPTRRSLDKIIAQTNSNSAPNTSKTTAITRSHGSVIPVEARILMMKLLYLCNEPEAIDQHFDPANLNHIIHAPMHKSNARLIRLVAEAYAIKGLQLERMHSRDSVSARDQAASHFGRCAELCLQFLQCVETDSSNLPMGGSTGNLPCVTNFLEYAVQRVPSLLLSQDTSGIQSVETLRLWLQKSEIRFSSELRSLLARQLAEVLMRIVTDEMYSPFSSEGRGKEARSADALLTSNSWSFTGSVGTGGKGFAGGNLSQSLNVPQSKLKSSRSPAGGFAHTSNPYVPATRTEEVILLLLITECLVNRELVLDMGADHENLRGKRVREENFVLDLLTIVLVTGSQYSLLNQAVERGMKVAYENAHLWFKFALSLICSERYSRAVTVLKECSLLDPQNYLYPTFTAKVALQHMDNPEMGIKSLESAIQLCQKGENVSCYEEARLYMLLAIGWAMKADSPTINIADKREANEKAMLNFKKAFELDDGDAAIAYNFALCLAKSRKIDEAYSLIKNYDDYGPSQQLNVLLLTSMKKYTDAKTLVTFYLNDNPDNITLRFLKLAVEERSEGPEVAMRALASLASHLTRLAAQSTHSPHHSRDSVSLGRSVDNHMSSVGPGSVGSTLGRSGTGGGRLTASFDALETQSIRTGTGTASYAENYALSDGMTSSVASSPHRALQMQNLAPEDNINLNIWILMFELLVKMDQLDEARNCFSELRDVVRSDQSFYHLCTAEGLLHEREGAPLEAKARYQEALVFNPYDLDTRHRLACLLKEEGSLESAEKLLRECLPIDLYHERSWQLLGGVLDQKGDVAGAAEALCTACTLEHSSPIKPFSKFLSWAF